MESHAPTPPSPLNPGYPGIKLRYPGRSRRAAITWLVTRGGICYALYHFNFTHTASFALGLTFFEGLVLRLQDEKAQLNASVDDMKRRITEATKIWNHAQEE